MRTGTDKERLGHATLANNTAWYLMLIGEYEEAERIGRSAVAASKNIQTR
jgi:Flp pilus assembly protein TadD